MPLSFKPGDILGMVLRSEAIVQYKPYFVAKDSFVAYSRDARNSRENESLSQLVDSDNMMPLLFLHICKLNCDTESQKIYFLYLQVQKMTWNMKRVWRSIAGIVHYCLKF